MLLLLAPILLVVAGEQFFTLRERGSEEFQENLELGRAVGVAFDAYLQDITRQERTLGRILTAQPSLSTEQATELLSASASDYPTVRHFSWLSPQGRVVFSSDAHAIGMDFGDRPYLRQIAAGEDWVVSGLLRGQMDGEPTFVIVQGVRDAYGVVQGMVVAAIDPAQIWHVLRVERYDHGSITIINRDGTLVYWYPAVQLSWDERGVLAENPLIARALAGREANGVFTSVFDGRQSLAGVVPIASVGWVAAAVRPQDEAMGPAVQDLYRDVGILLLVLVIGLFLALLLSRSVSVPLRRLQEHALTLAHGKFDRRIAVTGVEELEDLAGAFNRMAEELQIRERQRDEYIHSISHDLRNPLTVILGCAQLVQRRFERTGAPDEELRHVTGIITEAKRANAMIEDLVEWARLDAGQVRLSRQSVDLRAFVLDLKRDMAQLGGQRITVVCTTGLPLVQADPDRLARILMNLLGNALKYSDPDTEVQVTLTAGEHDVTIAVADRGRGIAPDEMPHLFQRYFRTTTAQEHHDGLGLGLFITKGLVEAHGGRIWADSVLGQGSTFSFTLSHAGSPQRRPPVELAGSVARRAVPNP